MTIRELQHRMDSAEFSEWLWADARGELPDAYDTFGMVAAAVMNSGFRHPENMVGKEDFRPKFTTAEKEQEKQVKAFDRMTAKPDYSRYIWQT
jgi:hypothetical protein